MTATVLVGAFEAQLEAKVLLAFFVPAVVYMASAVGTKTEALLIRGLSAGVPLAGAARRELLTGLALGAVVAAAFLPFAWLVWGDGRVAATVALALFAGCSIATLVAMLLPWAFHRLGRDPAFGSGPLATVVQDLLSIAIYLAIASWIALVADRQRERASRIRRPSDAMAGSSVRYSRPSSNRYWYSGARRARMERSTVTPSASGGGSLAGGATPFSASQRGRNSPATLPCGHQSGAPSASPRPRSRRMRWPVISRPCRTGSPGSGTVTPASRATPAAATRAWWVARPPNLTGEAMPSPAAHVRSAPCTRPSSPVRMKPSSSQARPSSAGRRSAAPRTRAGRPGDRRRDPAPRLRRRHARRRP